MTTVAEIATLAHGYTMAHVENIAWSAAHRERWLDPEEAHDAAWHAVVLRLYDTSEPPPTRLDLYTAALRATQTATRAHLRHHGYNPNTGEERPAFGRYWLPISGPKSDFTDAICERLALPQVLSVLTPLQYEALATLAVHETQADAAAALGVSADAFYNRIKHARARARAAWFDAESAPSRKIQRADGTEQCRSGHPRAEHGKKLKNGDWQCLACRRSSSRRYRRAFIERQKAAAVGG